MPGRPARKRIHYVRAVFPEGSPAGTTLQGALTRALRALPDCGDTQVRLASLGVGEIRQRNVTKPRILLAMGAGQPDEAMSTMGLNVDEETDADGETPPPRGRAFKIADAFCLIADNEVLVCVDGMRVSAVAHYLRRVLHLSNSAPLLQSFELENVSDADQQQILDEEGIKAVRVTSVLRQATVELNDETAFGTLYGQMKTSLRALFASDIDENMQDTLAQHYDEIQVRTVISAKGGSRAEPVVLEALDNAGREIFDDAPEGVSVELVTTKGTTVHPESLSLGVYASLSRNEQRNDLPYLDVWQKLLAAEDEFRVKGLWNA